MDKITTVYVVVGLLKHDGKRFFFFFSSVIVVKNVNVSKRSGCDNNGFVFILLNYHPTISNCDYVCFVSETLRSKWTSLLCEERLSK